jgi:hypothetical protein
MAAGQFKAMPGRRRVVRRHAGRRARRHRHDRAAVDELFPTLRRIEKLE